MSEQEPRELPADLQQLLRSAKPPLPPAGFDAAVLARVKSTLALPIVPTPPAAPVGPTAMATKMGAWGVKVSLATLVLGVASGTIVGRQFLVPPPAQIVVVRPPVEAPIAAVPSPSPTPTPSPEPQPAPDPVSVRPGPRKSPKAPAGSRDVDLAEERALIEVARTSLARREAARTLELLAEHSRRFPRGQLGEERDSLWVQALVKVARYSDARLKAQEFHLKYTESMLRPSVDAAIEAIPK